MKQGILKALRAVRTRVDWKAFLASLGPAIRTAIRTRVDDIRRDPIIIGFFFVGILALFLGLGGIGSEWIYHHKGWKGAQRSIEARNYHRFGYLHTGLAPLDNVGPAKGSKGEHITMKKFREHPPGFPLVLSLWAAVMGGSEPAARLLALVLSMATLIMLLYIFHRSWEDEAVLIAGLILLFIPVYAAYMNFVNQETLAVCCMFGVLACYEALFRDRKVWKLVFLGIFVFVGIFSDYAFILFLAYALVALSIMELRQGIRHWKVPVVVAGAGLLGSMLLLVQLRGMGLSWASWKGIFLDGGGYGSILEKWNYYIWVFNPLVVVLMAYWLLDLVGRVFAKKLTRADGYAAALLLSGLTAWLMFSQTARTHEYAVIYLCPPLALAAGRGLWQFAGSIAYGSRVIRAVVTAAGVVLVVGISVPHMAAKRVTPLYQFVEPMVRINSSKQYDFQLSYNIMARYLKGVMAPDEKLATFAGLDIRPEFQYYLDRESQGFRDRLDVLNLESRKDFAFFMVGRGHIWSDFLTHLLARHDFVVHDGNYAFDLGKHLPRTVALKRVLKKTSVVEKYFRSLSYGKYRVEEDLWRSLDLAVKLRSAKEAGAVRKTLGAAKADSLHAAVALYNYELSQGRKVDLAAITSTLDVAPKQKMIFGQFLEYLGAGLVRHEDGRTVLTMLFRPVKVLSHNFKVELTAETLQEGEAMREALGTKKFEMRFVIPSNMWKTGYVYALEEQLQLYPGPYRLSFNVQWLDYFQVLNRASNENSFPVVCKALPGEPLEALAQITARMMEIDARGIEKEADVRKNLADLPAKGALVSKGIGPDLVLLGCVAVPASTGRWLVRMYFQNRSMEARDLYLTMSGSDTAGKGLFEKTMAMGKMSGDKAPGRIFWVEETVEHDPEKAKIRIKVGAKSIENVLKSNVGATQVRIGEGDYGIDFPLMWLYWPQYLF